MSRSYKKTPYCGDRKGKDKKRVANSSVRQYLKDHEDANLQGNSYKKIHDSWDICDYSWITIWEEYWAMCWKHYYWLKDRYPDEEHKKPNEKEEYRRWRKWYYNK